MYSCHIFIIGFYFNFNVSPDNTEYCGWGSVVCIFFILFYFYYYRKKGYHVSVVGGKQYLGSAPGFKKDFEFIKVTLIHVRLGVE